MQRNNTIFAERHGGFRSAFTLVEAMIASVVLAVIAVGIAGNLAATSMQATSTAEMATSSLLARQLLEEIAAKPFPSAATTAPGWLSGNENRATYDDVSDYNGYTDRSPFTALSGASITTAGSYSRTVTFTRRANPSDTPSTAGNFGLVTVTVTAPSGLESAYSVIVSGITQVRP